METKIEGLDTKRLLETQFEVTASIARRRSLGKYLAFAKVKIIEIHSSLSTVNHEHYLPQKVNEDEEGAIQIVFRRKSGVWESSEDNLFPTKNSELPYGAIVKLNLCRGNDESEDGELKYEVRRWSLLVDPRKQAIDDASQRNGENISDSQDGVSCSKYFTARMNQYLKHNSNSQTTPRRNKQAAVINSQPAGRIQRNVRVQGPHGDKRHKGLRAKLFASFLVDKFGTELFQEGAGVLDIAGGKGLLSR